MGPSGRRRSLLPRQHVGSGVYFAARQAASCRASILYVPLTPRTSHETRYEPAVLAAPFPFLIHGTTVRRLSSRDGVGLARAAAGVPGVEDGSLQESSASRHTIYS